MADTHRETHASSGAAIKAEASSDAAIKNQASSGAAFRADVAIGGARPVEGAPQSQGQPPPPFAYHLCMLSMAGLDLLLSGLFAIMAGAPHAILLRLPEVLGVLVLLNLAGAERLRRPLMRFRRQRTPENAAAAALCLGRLAERCGLWAVFVSALFAAWTFGVSPFLIWRLEPTSETLALLAARAAAWVVLLPMVAYFLLHEHLRRLRNYYFHAFGLITPPGGAQLGSKFALILVGGAVVPGLSIVITLLLVPPISPISGAPRELILHVTLIGSAIALAIAFRAMRRSVSDSLSALTQGLARVQSGDLSVRLAPQTDDELGRLSQDFNTLTDTLAQTRAMAVKAEADRAASAQRFHEAQKQSALGRLAAGVAHDFNNILAIVMGYAAMVRRKMAEDDANRRKLDEVLKAAERGKALIGQIMAFTREGEDTLTPVDMAASVRQSVKWVGAALTGRCRVTAALPDAPLIVAGDATAIHQVTTNLCVNAAQAMNASGGTIHVALDAVTIDGGRAEGLTHRLRAKDPAILVDASESERLRCFVGILRPGRHARLTVRDEGPGIDAVTLNRIFEPYFTTKPVGEGTGLGLAAVMGIVARHRGAVTLTTRPDSGACFEIFIPLAAEAP